MSEAKSAFMAELIDPYGNDGADPDPQWSGQWSRWSRAARDDYLAKVPRLGPLKFAQMADILQGLPPRPSGWEAITTCTEEAYGAVARLRWEIERGRIAPSLTPSELRAWCEANHVEVPEVLSSMPASERDAGVAAGGVQTAIDVGEEISFPAWVAITPDHQKKTSPVNKRVAGRPATAAQRNSRVVQAATDFVISEAQQGRTPHLADVATHVESIAAGMSSEDIKRRLKGKLPLNQAKQIAHQARQRARRDLSNA